MTNLSEQDGERLLAIERFNRQQGSRYERIMRIAPAVEDIVRRARETAWDEGYDMGDPYQRRGNPNEGKHRNPYRAPGDAQEPVLASNTRSVDLGDAGDVEGAQNGADDGVRGGGA